MSRRQPNILWYCTDQQRYDTIHALGNPSITTPNIDSLCQRGVAFERAYCQSPICTPSRASFLTGRYPNTHHVHRNSNEFFPPTEILVTKLLADAGYNCGLVGKLHLSKASKGNLERRPDDGYREFYWSQHPNPDYPYGHDYAIWLKEEKGVDPVELYESIHGHVGAGVPTEFHQTTWCTERAIRFITEHPDRPWLLSVNPFDPHPPFDPPEAYLRRYDPEKMPFPLFRESDIEQFESFRCIDQQADEVVNPYAAGGEAHDEGTVERGDMGRQPPKTYDAQLVKATYYAMIELIDEQFSRILHALEETGQLENTLIVFMSDHGEMLGDHGLIYKGCRFFEGLVHVPLIVSWPGRGLSGVRSRALVELVDLAPTLLDAVGLDIPYYMQGRSLLPIITGEVPVDVHKDHVLCEYHDSLPGVPNHSHGTMYFDGRYKLCIYEGHYDLGELYDLVEDPGEFDNRWNDRAYAELKTDLIIRHFHAYLSTSSAGVRRASADFPGPGAGLAPKSPSIFD